MFRWGSWIMTPWMPVCQYQWWALMTKKPKVCSRQYLSVRKFRGKCSKLICLLIYSASFSIKSSSGHSRGRSTDSNMPFWAAYSLPSCAEIYLCNIPKTPSSSIYCTIGRLPYSYSFLNSSSSTRNGNGPIPSTWWTVRNHSSKQITPRRAGIQLRLLKIASIWCP